MSETSSSKPKRRLRLWLTVSELVGLLALVLAGLNYWDSRRERADEMRREAAADRAAQARSSLVLNAEMQAEGARLSLQPLAAGQAIQSQRYLFPHDVLGHAMEVAAARPQIDLSWIEAGLRQDIERRRKAGTAAGSGEGELPVGVYTTYVEDGELRSDRSLYRMGYAWRTQLLGGPKLMLEGLSLVRRAVPGDLRKAVEIAWRSDAPAR
jgi:hypothetical protein